MIQSLGQLCGWPKLVSLPNPYFPTKKVVEQETSTLALEITLGKTKDEQPLMYKNRLQDFTTRLDFAIPVYQSINKGQPRDPKFRSTVWVAEISYTSQSTFPQNKSY